MTMVDEIKLRQFIGRTLGDLGGALSVPLAIVRWAAIVVLLAVAGQASTSWQLAASERLDTPPQRATPLIGQSTRSCTLQQGSAKSL